MDRLLKAAVIPMRALAHRLKVSCHVCTLEHDRLAVLAQADSPDFYRFYVEVGATFSPLPTASGRLLLAYLKEDAFRHFCQASSEYRKLTRAGRDKLLSMLRQIRRKGISTASDEPVVGVRSYAVLIGNPRSILPPRWPSLRWTFAARRATSLAFWPA